MHGDACRCDGGIDRIGRYHCRGSRKRREIVRLGEIGSFQIGLRGKGAVSEEEYSASLIRKAKVNFRPGVALTEVLSGLSFAKVGKLPLKKKEEGGSGGDGEGEDPAA